MIALAIALAATLAQPPAQSAAERKMGVDAMILETPSARTVAKGDQSNVDDAKQVLVRSEAEWTKVWNQHAPDQPKPAVDFSKEMVVAVFMGSRPSAGFSTTITSAMAAKGALLVHYKETAPPAGAVTAQILTFPFHIVAIAKAPVTDVKFQKDEK